MYEVVPVIGCEFQCIYCNALGQEEEEKFLPVRVDTNYPNFLRQEIEKHKESENTPIYYYSAKTDCFQKPLLDSGVTENILKVFKEMDCQYILVTKGVPSESVYKVMLESKNKCQIIITYGMPNDDMRKLVEPMSSSNKERMEFAKRCVEDGFQISAIIEPIFPFNDLSFVEDIMYEFVKIGINHFAVDFARISHTCFNRLLKAIPQYEEELKINYLAEDCNNEMFKTAAGTYIKRYSPSKSYMLDKFNNFKEIAKKWDATVSICNSFGFDGFNIEAGKRGYICMGINFERIRTLEIKGCKK
jgi:DNA repair photolyase